MFILSDYCNLVSKMSAGGGNSWTMGTQPNQFPSSIAGNAMPMSRGGGVSGGMPVPTSNAPINLKLLLSGEEVKYLFGAEEVLLNQLKQQTGSNIQLTEPGPHERVLSIAGPLDAVIKAFGLVCRKLWEFVVSLSDPNNPKMLVLRLAVHASQCGMIIGKQGSKVREIRELTGATVNICQDSLPESNERAVEVIGTGEACLQSTYHICTVLQENPPRGEVIPYRPRSLMKDLWKPIILAGEKAYIIENGIAILAPPELVKKALAETPLGMMTAALSNMDDPSGPEHMNPVALMAAISTSQRDKVLGGGGPEITKEMRIENEVAGSVIGKHGTKVAEIRQISGAHVSINTEDEITETGERLVIIKGTAESVLLAQFLVQANIDLYKKERVGGPPLKQEEYTDSMEPPGHGGREMGGFGRGGGNQPFFGGGRGGGGRGGGMNFNRGGRRSPPGGRGNMQMGGRGGKGRRR